MRLGINISVSRQYGGFSPASVFAAGQAGVWYDPSDINTLFQTTATPVTAAGQAVGVMLDKSKNLTPGPQLVTNGTFNTDTTGWSTVNGAVIGVVDGKMQVFNSTAANGNAYQAITTVVGKTYLLTGQISDVTGGISPRIMAGTSISAGDLVSSQYSGSGTFYVRAVFVATGVTTYVNAIMNTTTSGVYASFDNLSVQEIPGNHAFQSTAGSRPLYQIDGTGRPYLQFDGVDDNLSVTTLNLSGVPYVAAVVGQRKEQNISQVLISHGTPTSFAGFWQLFAPRGTTNYGWRGFNAANIVVEVSGGIFPAPDLAVITGLFDPSAASGMQITGRRNGSQIIQAGTGLAAFISTSFSVGKRGPTGDAPYLGRVYGVIVVGATSSAATVASMENWMNSKTGAY